MSDLHERCRAVIVLALLLPGCRQPRDVDLELALSAGAGDVAEVKRLLSRGADPNRYDFRTLSPLHAAAAAGHLKVAEILVAAGARVDGGNPTALQYAASEDHLAVAEYLIDKGADPTRGLSGAARKGHLGMVRLLVARGGQLRDVDDAGGPLAIAAAYGQVDVVEWLISEGMSVNIVDRDGYSPLHSAAWTGNLAVVRLLIGAGGDVNRKTSDGHTPLSLAEKNGHGDVAQYLKTAGAT